MMVKMNDENMKEGLAVYEAKKELHSLMRKVIKSTKLGRRHSTYDDSLGLDIGGGELWSCFRFNQLEFSPIEAREDYDCDGIEISDSEMVQCLIKEIKKRYELFQDSKKKHQKDYLKGKKKFAHAVFDESIKHIVEMYN